MGLLIRYQILQTNIMRIISQTVRRITNEILGVKGLLYNCYDVSQESLVLDQPIITQLTFFFSHYLSAWYHVDTVRRNSVLVTLGSLKVNRDCDTIPQLSNYSTKYFLHFSDDKCKTIYDILKEHTQFSQKKYSVTFTSKNLPTPAKHKITTIMQ